MSDNFERRQPTAAEVAYGWGLEADLLNKRIAELEAEVERLRAERWEPVRPHGYERITDVMDVYEADGEMLLRWYTEGYYWDVALPANIRLCRKEARNDS